MRCPRSLAVVATALASLLLLPTAAWAHASFDVTQLPAGSTQDLALRVPLERDAANDLVEVLVPGAFTIEACDATEGWTCEQDETTEGDVVVTLARAPGGPGDTERFDLTVTAPTAEGVYAFPTIQTYDDGEEVSWIGEEGSDQPAPRIQVGDETTEVEFSGEATPHTDRASEDPATSPTEGPTAAAGTEPEDAAPSEDADGTEEPTAPATGAPGDETTVEDLDPESEAPVGTGEGGPSATVLLVGAALLVAFAIAVLVARRRQRPR